MDKYAQVIQRHQTEQLIQLIRLLICNQAPLYTELKSSIYPKIERIYGAFFEDVAYMNFMGQVWRSDTFTSSRGNRLASLEAITGTTRFSVQ